MPGVVMGDSSDSESGTQLLNSGEHSSNTESHPTADHASGGAQTLNRPQRDRKLALKAKENKAIKLSSEFMKCVGKQLQLNENFLKDVNSTSSDEIDIDGFEAQLVDVSAKFTAMYNELQVLYDNKLEPHIQTLFEQYEFDAQLVQDSIKGHRDQENSELAQMEQEIEQSKRELEQEMKDLEERLAARRIRMEQLQKSKREKNLPLNSSPATQIQEETVTGGLQHNITEMRAQAAITRQQNTEVEIQRQTARERPGSQEPALASQQEETVSSNPISMITSSKVEAANSLPNDGNLSATNNTDALCQLSACLMNSLRASKLPPPEPSTFTGNPLEYNDWELSFNSLIETKGLSDMEKLHYLKRYVNGEAKQCISGYFLYNSASSYTEARKLLKERFGNAFEVSRAFRAKLAKWPKITPKDSTALRKYSDYLTQCLSAMNSVPELRILDDNQENERMTSKLPEWMRLRWGRVVADCKRNRHEYPKFQRFVEFVREEAEIMSEPILQYGASSQPEQQREQSKAKTVRSYHSHTANTDEEKGHQTNTNRAIICIYCNKSNHVTTECRYLANATEEEKTRFVKEHRLCYACLKPNHRSKECRKRSRCKKCQKPHPTALHKEQWNTQDRRKVHQNEQERQAGSNSTEESTEDRKLHVNTAKRNDETSLSMIVPVYVCSGTREELVYALLDTQSDASFITKETADKIMPSCVQEKLTVVTLNGESTQLMNRYTLQVRSYGKANSSQIPIQAYEQDEIPCNREQIPNRDHARNLPYLESIAKELPPKLNIPVGLLIGTDCSQVLAPRETLLGDDGQPFAVKTLLGWTLCGGRSSTTNCKVVHRAQTTKETLSLEYVNDNDTQKVSQDDLKFLGILENGLTQLPNGNYSLPLPFKKEPVMPNNKVQAEKRFNQLRQKLLNDEPYKKEYFKFMRDVIDSGHAERVASYDKADGRVWYIPHFGVFHPKKKKLRVVFDGSAVFEGQSLNSMLLPGPEHMNSLIGILLRFRQERIAISCDIEKMFHNFKVADEHRDFLRFLWTDETINEVNEYRMTVHLFGATSSPGVATFALRKVAQVHKERMPLASEFIINNFYVDDGITSVRTAPEASQLITDTVNICSSANLRLHKFASNSREVLVSIPKAERNKDIQEIDLFGDKLPTERTLGLEWCIERDVIEFKNNMSTKASTRRGILSTVSQIYDPLGLLSPFILQGRIVMQKACSEGKPWDEDVTPELKEEWLSWTKQLKNLETIQLPRCVKPAGFDDTVHAELHLFSDASLSGYGACAYLRLVNNAGKVHVCLLLGKSRVSPLKATTIPRLELQAAVEAVRLSVILNRELNMQINSRYFWTDSTATLGYIKNSTARYQMFVANRIQEIRNSSEPDQWHHVAGKLNPADIASRGASLLELNSSSWWNGPEFLQQLDINRYLPDLRDYAKEILDNPEVKKTKTVLTTSTNRDSMTMVFEKFSSWSRLVRAVANAKAIFRNNLKNRDKKKPVISVQDLQEAEHCIIRMDQMQHFSEEIIDLKEKKQVRKQSSITRLTPALDEEGMLRMNGRATKSTMLSYQEVNPLVLHKSSHIAKLIVRHYHEKTHHQGRSFTLGSIREAGYWITSASTVVKSLIHNCITCKRIRGKPAKQQMGQLPKERVEPSPPFTHVGMDCFGPFLVKDRRTEYKQWGLVFTCMYSRAVHIELVKDMSTDTFINALRCFVCIRGPVKTLFCDNGTNFIGARNELAKELEQVKDERLKQYLLANKIHFNVNTPSASHQGGVWERQIRTIRSVLNGMMTSFSSRLDTTGLRTALYEVMATVNSRPLAVNSPNDPNEPMVTPNHLLTMKNGQPSSLPGSFSDQDTYSRKMWRRVQLFAETFWKRWKASYLTNISLRQRWENKQPNVKIGDVVLLIEEDTRNNWRMGIVEGVKPGPDGLVRKVTLRLANRTILDRPVQKIVVLINSN